MLSLKDCQTSQFNTAAGGCVTSPEFFELLNDTVDELMRRGDWPGTLVPIRVCVRNGCVTWPRYVGEVRKINLCTSSAPVQNVWHQFMEHGQGHRGIYGWNSWCAGETKMQMQFRAPTYNDIYQSYSTVRVYPMVQQDAGATVTLFGLDQYNQPLKELVDGEWRDGVTITVANPFGSTSVFVNRIDRVVKSVTQGKLNMYSYDVERDVLWDLASYEPSETNPDYLRYRLEGSWPTETCASSCNRTVIALVKLQNLPIRVPTDLVIINNRRALLLGIRALRMEQALGDASALWRAAIESLNRDAENASPDEQMSVQNNILAGQSWSNRMF